MAWEALEREAMALAELVVARMDKACLEAGEREVVPMVVGNVVVEALGAVVMAEGGKVVAEPVEGAYAAV